MLSSLLSGRLPDPDGSGQLAVPTRAVVIEESLAGQEPRLLGDARLGPALLLVADSATWDALGARVYQSLQRVSVATHVFPADVHPTIDSVMAVQAAAERSTGLIAVGSGTINDIVKCAAARLGKPYVVFGTAASMNGYTSVNASITEHGHKKSVPAAAPVAAFFDLGVLVAAPARLTRAGVGDSVCRSTAQTDWLLSHLLLGTDYRHAPFELLRAEEEALMRAIGGLAGGSLQAMGHLMHTLVLSGFGMTICGGSHPASQGEHLISHYLEMFGDPAWPASLHGEQIAVTTLTMARLQGAMLAQTSLASQTAIPGDAEFQRHFGKDLGEAFAREFARKMSAASAAQPFRRMAEEWPDICAELRRVHQPAETLEAALRAVAAPTSPQDLGVPIKDYREAVRHARYIRDRYTFLDLAGDTGHAELLAEI